MGQGVESALTPAQPPVNHGEHENSQHGPYLLRFSSLHNMA